MNEETIIRTAVVTGGSRGIGRAVCVQLARQGCHVVVNYCHGEAAAAETVSLCRAMGAQAVAVQADVSTAEGCKKLFEEAVNAFGRVDILVNNAGITRDNLILRMSEADFDAVLDANLKGAFLCCKEAARRMVRQRYGRIVNLSSVVALRGNAGQTKRFEESFSSHELTGKHQRHDRGDQPLDAHAVEAVKELGRLAGVNLVEQVVGLELPADHEGHEHRAERHCNAFGPAVHEVEPAVVPGIDAESLLEGDPHAVCAEAVDRNEQRLNKNGDGDPENDFGAVVGLAESRALVDEVGGDDFH